MHAAMCDYSLESDDDSSLSDDLIDFLCELDQDSSDTSTHCTESVSCKTVTKKRKSRSRYDAPKVFKYDVRWSYGDMLNLVFNGCDPYVAYSFFKTFARPDMGHTNRRLPAPPEDKPKYRGIANFVKGWYITTITAPDATFRASNYEVKNRPDGSSTVSCSFEIRKTDVYLCPPIADVDMETVSVTNDDLGDAKVQMFNLWNHTRKKARAIAGMKAKSSSLQQRKVRALPRCPSDLTDGENSFLDCLENVSQSLTLSPTAGSESHCIAGVLVMNLTENKVIQSCEYILNALN